jgi:hypothetical protein
MKVLFPDPVNPMTAMITGAWMTSLEVLTRLRSVIVIVLQAVLMEIIHHYKQLKWKRVTAVKPVVVVGWCRVDEEEL